MLPICTSKRVRPGASLPSHSLTSAWQSKICNVLWVAQNHTIFAFLCENRLEAGTVKAEDIKKALEEEQRDKNTVDANDEEKEGQKSQESNGEDINKPAGGLLESNAHFVELHNLFLDVCELYVDIVVDKDGRHSRFDKMAR